MKKAISIVCLVAAGLTANAQLSRYQDRLITTSGNNSYSDFVYNANGSSSIIGRTTSSASHGVSDIIYSTVNKWGDFTNYTAYYTSATDYGYAITPFGTGYAVSGSTNVSGSYDILVFPIGTTSFTPELIGGSGNEEGYSIHATSDGGMIIAGFTTSYGAGAADGYLVKLTSTGAIAWTSTYGTTGNDYFYDAIQTSDGGYLAVGRKPQCFSGSLEDQMAVKFTSTGTVSWARCIGNPGTQVTSPNEWAKSVVETSDGYVFAGTCNDGGGFAFRMFLTKITKTGAFVFMKMYDTVTMDYCYDLIATTDGGFLLGGHRNTLDAALVKTDAYGNLQWAKAYNVDNSSANGEYGHAIAETPDGYEMAGASNTAAFILRSDFNGITGCNETPYTPTVVSLTAVFGTLGTTTGSGGTVSSVTLSTGTSNTSEFSYNCRLCPVDAGPNKMNVSNTCCVPVSCSAVQIGTTITSGYPTYSWSPCTALSSCSVAQPNASPCTPTTYTLTVSRNDCTTNTDAVTVTPVYGTACCGPKRLANPGDSAATMEYEVTIFPNPSNGSFHVTLGDGIVSSIIITDITGRKVYERFNIADNNLDIDLSAESKGMYILTAVIEGQTITQKISFE